ncbi:MAG: protein-export chaperone SecB [Bacilli bacterium]|nr:protein-export chaperone SecB [Bacilli bacterium]
MDDKNVELKNLHCTKLRFDLRDAPKGKLNVAYSVDIKPIDEDSVLAFFGIRIGGDDSWVYCSVELQANVCAKNYAENEEDKHFMLKQSASLLYPYVRSAVSSLFATAGQQPLVLPALPVGCFDLQDEEK